MGHIVCVANLLEKSGRTMTAVNLSASLAVLEQKVLLVDCDPHGEASSSLGWGHSVTDFGLDDLLSGIVSGRAVVKKTVLEFLDIIPAGQSLDDIDSILSENPDKEKILRIVLEKFKGRYDFIFFDTPARKNLLTRSALMASDSLLIPIRNIEKFDQGLMELLQLASRVRKSSDDTLGVLGILFIGYETIEHVNSLLDGGRLLDFQHAFYPVVIPERKPVAASVKRMGPDCLQDIASGIAEAFLDLSFEFLYRESMNPLTNR